MGWKTMGKKVRIKKKRFDDKVDWEIEHILWD